MSRSISIFCCIQIFYKMASLGISWRNVQCVGVLQDTESTLVLKSFLHYFRHHSEGIFCLTYDFSFLGKSRTQGGPQEAMTFLFQCQHLMGKKDLLIKMPKEIENLRCTFSTIEKFFSLLQSLLFSIQ